MYERVPHFVGTEEPARLNANRKIVAHSLGEVRSFLDELKHGSRKYRTIESLSEQIAEAYRGRCVLELLQNAHDALGEAPGADPGMITFMLETEPAPVLLVANSGRAFEHKNFKGLCRLGQSPKDPNRSIGNKGLGFRSVLEVASAPEIWSSSATENEPAFVFRFDPGIRKQIATAIAELEERGCGARSPFDPAERLVDWTEDQLEQYRNRLAEEGMNGREEAMEFLSPYDIPVPIEYRNDVVDKLLCQDHVTVVRLPLDGGLAKDVRGAVASVQEQLTNLLNVSTPLFLPWLKTLVVDIDGERTLVRRTVDTDEAFGKDGRSRWQRVKISRSDTAGETGSLGRFLVWTRDLGGTEDPQWATRIKHAVRHAEMKKWHEIDSVKVGVAVQEGNEGADGRFGIFLPTEMATGTGAHINAPFLGSMDRRMILFKNEYNRLLLDCVMDLSLDVIDDLSAGPPQEASGRAIVDILSSNDEVGDTGKSMLSLLCERADARGTPFGERRLILCDKGWITPSKARVMPKKVDASLVIGAEEWRRAAAFAVLSGALNGRKSEVIALIENLGGSAAPTNIEWIRTMEEVALRVQSGQIDATWNDFLTSVLEMLPSSLVWKPKRGTEDALSSARFLPVQNERLISGNDPVRVFFQPVIGMDNTAELVNTVPNSLEKHIAFVHDDVRIHEEGTRRQSTDVHEFLNGRFVRKFEREEIIRDVVLSAVPLTPATFGSAEAELCAELLGWTLRLLGDNPREGLLDLLKDLPVACHGGWRRVREASFGPGWSGCAGENLQMLCEELKEDAGERLRETMLLEPTDPRWSVDVAEQESLFARIGVAQGLRLRPVDKIHFRMKQRRYELPQKTPPGVDSTAWEKWRTAIRREAEPQYVGWFKYSLEDIFHLPELAGCANLSQRGRKALSQLIVESMSEWPEGWEKATIQKTEGSSNSWNITAPLKYWLSTIPWLSDSTAQERPLSDRWLVPTSLPRGQHEQFRHLRPLSLDLSRRLDRDEELREGLGRLGLNVYPTDGEKIGPELLDTLANAWTAQEVPPNRFDIFLGQLRHAWNSLDEAKGLPRNFLVRTARRRFEVRDGENLGDVYLPDHEENGRALREEGKYILEMERRKANQFARILVEAAGVRCASKLVERVLIDGTEWNGTSDRVQALAETRWRWLPVPLLTIAAHGGANPTGPMTRRWDTALDRLRVASVVECESIAVALLDGEKIIAKSEPDARWITGNVLAVTNKIENMHELLAPATQAMLDRQDLLKDLRLVLGRLNDSESPSREQIEDALDRAEIDAQAFADIHSRWTGNAGLVADRIRPVATLLEIAGEEFENTVADMDRLTDWLSENLPQREAAKLITAAHLSLDDHAMGLAAWRALGDVAQLPAWNAVLERLGDEYELIENKHACEQTAVHLESMQAMLAALACKIASDCGEPQLFRKIEETTGKFTAPDEWTKQWWDVPFVAVVEALRENCLEVVDAEHLEVLRGATSANQLQLACEKNGVNVESDPYETARINSEGLKTMLLNAYDLYRIWLETHAPESKVPDQPASPELDGEAYLRRWSEAELWRHALAILDNETFTTACGDQADLYAVRERLGIDEKTVKAIKLQRAEQEREAVRKPKKVEIAGASFEIGMIDYSKLLRQHFDKLAHPSGPRAKEDEFTLLETVPTSKAYGGGGAAKGRSAHRRLSTEEAAVVGIVGEIHAYRYLRREFGGRAIQPRAWVSESRLEVCPLVEGEKDDISDGHGFDFRFNCDGIRWHVEVKATQGEATSFDLGITEIEAATRIARRRGNAWRWRILRVRNALSAEPQIDWLPNPFEEGFRKNYRLHRGGMVVSYARLRP